MEFFKLLQIKAYDEWQGYLLTNKHNLKTGIQDADPELKKRLQETRENWVNQPIEERIESLRLLMDVIDETFREGRVTLGALRIFSNSAWLEFRERKSVEPLHNTSEIPFDGVHTQYHEHGIDHPIVIIEDTFMKENDFLETVHLLGHETCHAILEIKYQQFWSDVDFDENPEDLYLPPSEREFIDHPLYLTMLVMHAERYGEHSLNKDQILQAHLEQRTEETYKTYLNVYDERLAEDFADMLQRIVEKAI